MLEERRGRADAVAELGVEPLEAAQEAAELRRRVERGPPEGARALRGPPGAHREYGEHHTGGAAAPGAAARGEESRAPATARGPRRRARQGFLAEAVRGVSSQVLAALLGVLGGVIIE